MAKIVTLGEIMLRLKSPGFERLMQSPSLEATFGGGEANVAVALAHFGMDAAFVTVLPDNPIADACMRQLRSFGVDTSLIVRKEGRMGVYYLESGSNARPSKVLYDRADSTAALASPGTFNWDTTFAGAEWFHFTGITPALSESAAALCLDALRACRQRGIHVSCDLNYRKNLWKWGRPAREVMTELMAYTDTVIANEEDFQMALGLHSPSDVESGGLNPEDYKALARAAAEAFPSLRRVAITLRESVNANINHWSACLYENGMFYVSAKYALTDIVDRVGGGDAFGGGLIYGLNTYDNPKQALEFAVAASCLKHTIPGDFCRVSVKEAEALMAGSGSGRVQR